MHRLLRDRRIRGVLVLLVALLALALSWHLLVGLHPMAMMLGLCIAVMAAGSVLLPARSLVFASAALPPREPVQPVRRPRIEPIGRHPPDEGIRLRH